MGNVIESVKSNVICVDFKAKKIDKVVGYDEYAKFLLDEEKECAAVVNAGLARSKAFLEKTSKEDLMKSFGDELIDVIFELSEIPQYQDKLKKMGF